METKEFTKADELVEWLAGSYLAEWQSCLATNYDVLIQEAEEAAAEAGEDEEEVDVEDTLYIDGSVGDPNNEYVKIRPKDYQVFLNGKEIPLYGEKSIFWLSECGLEWIYTCFTYDKGADEYKNVDLDFSISDAVRFYAQGYLAAMN